MDQRLVEAARVGDVTTLHNLMEADPEILERASLDHFADSALHVAALYGKADFVEQIVSRMPSLARETNQKGMIPLHLASSKGHVDTVRELLKAKLDDDDGVNQCLVKDDDGWNPLHCASQKGKISIIEELISKCPECLEQVTAKGETVVHLAVKSNQFEAVRVLAHSIKSHNLHIMFKVQDQKGKTAYQLAAVKKLQSQVVELLKEDDEEIRDHQERRINVEGEESEAADKEEEKSDNKVSHHEFRDAIIVMASLLITLTYQALANPPSTIFKDGSSSSTSTMDDWGCILKDPINCPTVLALFFIIFNSMIFFTSIQVVINTLRGPSVFFVRMLTVYLIFCYCFMLAAVHYNFLYFAVPNALIVFSSFLFSRAQDDVPGITYLIIIYRILAKKVFPKGWVRDKTRSPRQQLEGSHPQPI